MCRYTEVIDGTLSLLDIATMNDIADVFDENAARAEQARNDASRAA
jgi:hypothetical protein